MQASLERLENNQVALQVEVAAERVDEALGKAYNQVVKRINIPGFRKGKVPRAILEARMGREVLYEDALDILFPQAYKDAVAEHTIEPIGKPEMDVVQFEQGKPFIFKVKVDVMPDVKLGEYKGIEAEMPDVTVGEDEVGAYLNMLQQRHARLIDAGDEPAGDGDIIVVDYNGTIDGELEPRLSAKERSLEIGSHKLIPGFDAHLLGARAGQDVEFTMTLPSDLGAPELDGKEASFAIKVTGLKHKEVSALDDEFARDVSDCDTLEALKAQTKNNLEKEGQYNARRIFAEKVISKVVANAEVEPPETLVDEQTNVELDEFSHNLAAQNLDMATYLRLVQKEPVTLRQDFHDRARETVKGRLVFVAIAKAEGITVAPEELDVDIKDAAIRYGMEEDKLRKLLEEKGQMRVFEQGLLLDKVQKFLTDNAKPLPAQPDGVEQTALQSETVTDAEETASVSEPAEG